MKRYKTLLMAGFFALGLGTTSPSIAQVYKYQDEHGVWHFTDCPPPGTKSELTYKKEEVSPEVSRDIAAELQKQFETKSSIARASLAVVSVKTRLSEGSGFFISNSGHIITNRHVVKASESDEWRELEAAVKEKREAYKSAEAEFNASRARLDKIKEELQKYRSAIDEAPDSYAKQIAEAEYAFFKHRYDEYRPAFDRAMANFRDRRRAFEKARSEFNWQTSAATLQRSFKIVLKDDRELAAELISLCDKHDIALLKLADGYKTPFLTAADIGALHQGMRVFAIGSPLGMKDAVTSGILTRVADDHLVTDATILPGSSGGPLIDEDGDVVGVNTLRFAEIIGGEGFGIAIPITRVKEFAGTILK